MTFDFSNVMSDHEAGYLREEDIYRLKDYFKYKAQTIVNEHPSWKGRAFRELQKGLLILTTYRTGRRISELVGQKPYEFGSCPGLRPCDFVPGDSIITFRILKKNHIRLKDSKGRPVPEAKLIEKRHFKKPKVYRVAVDIEMYNILVNFINKYHIPYHKRIFPFTRKTADLAIKEAAQNTGVILAGNRTIKHWKKGPESYVRPKDVHMHMLRHSFAINLLKRNSNNPNALLIVQDTLCHSNLEITRGYARFSQADRIELLSETFSPQSKNNIIGAIHIEEDKKEKGEIDE